MSSFLRTNSDGLTVAACENCEAVTRFNDTCHWHGAEDHSILTYNL